MATGKATSSPSTATSTRPAGCFEVVRKPGKQFKQRRPDGNGGYVWNLRDVRRVLYRLPEVLEAFGPERPIYVPEGEKDVEALERLGLVATCNPMGAGKWRSSTPTR